MLKSLSVCLEILESGKGTLDSNTVNVLEGKDNATKGSASARVGKGRQGSARMEELE